jgi:hypothetical protein
LSISTTGAWTSPFTVHPLLPAEVFYRLCLQIHQKNTAKRTRASITQIAPTQALSLATNSFSYSTVQPTLVKASAACVSRYRIIIKAACYIHYAQTVLDSKAGSSPGFHLEEMRRTMARYEVAVSHTRDSRACSLLVDGAESVSL